MHKVLFKYKKKLLLILITFLSYVEFKLINALPVTPLNDSVLTSTSRLVDYKALNDTQIADSFNNTLKIKNDNYFVNRILSNKLNKNIPKQHQQLHNPPQQAENVQKIIPEKIQVLEWQNNFNEFNDLDSIMSDNISCVLELSVKHLKWWVEDDGRLTGGVIKNSTNNGTSTVQRI